MARWRPTVVGVYALAVAANYVIQVPYDLDLYGTTWNVRAVLLLGATLVWFVAALTLYRSQRRIGSWLLLGYALAQVAFYADSEIVMSFSGFGLPYHLGRTGDPIVWWAFVIGDLDFLAAIVTVVHLVRQMGRDRPSNPDSGVP